MPRQWKRWRAPLSVIWAQALEELFESCRYRHVSAASNEAELTKEERAPSDVRPRFASTARRWQRATPRHYVFGTVAGGDRLILHAIHEAYRNVLPPECCRGPTFSRSAREEVDVNVHPAKIRGALPYPQLVCARFTAIDSAGLSRARPIPICPARATRASAAGQSADGLRQLWRQGGTCRHRTPRAVIPVMMPAGPPSPSDF